MNALSVIKLTYFRENRLISSFNPMTEQNQNEPGYSPVMS